MSKELNVPVGKLFAISENLYWYDTCKNEILLIDNAMYLMLSRIIKNDYDEESDVENSIRFQSLKTKGYFQNCITEIICNPMSPYLTDLLESNMKHLILQVTQNCNFNCRYCLYSGEDAVERKHQNINMDFEIARKAVSFFAEHSYANQKVSISFYGGEPLLNFDLIKKIIPYVNATMPTREIEYSMTINGSILNEGIAEFVIKNRIHLTISLDGPMGVQNKHRRFSHNGAGTFDVVIDNVLKLREKSPSYFAEYVSFLSVAIEDEDISEVFLFFQSMNIKKEKIKIIGANLNGIDYTLDNSVFYNQFERKKTEREYSTMEATDSIKSKLKQKSIFPKTWHPQGQCIPGMTRVFVDCFGNFYPCEKIIEDRTFLIGNVNNGFDTDKINSFMNIAKLTENECKTCWAARFCDMCITHCIDIEKHCITKEKKLEVCEQQKAQTLAVLKNIVYGRKK